MAHTATSDDGSPPRWSAPCWSAPAAFPVLAEKTAHVWHCDLDALASADYEPCLSQVEHERAARFHFPTHRARYIVGRGVLRTLLARYLGDAPEALKFTTNAHGKPELGGGNLRFNISHSQNFALLAFCLAHDIGVDIEFRRPDFDSEKTARLASRFFCEAESRELATLVGEENRAAFFRCWTRKEALLKATGEGIAGGLAKYQVSLLPGEAARVIAPSDEAAEWSLFDLQPSGDFAGALAVRGVGIGVNCYRFNSSSC